MKNELDSKHIYQEVWLTLTEIAHQNQSYFWIYRRDRIVPSRWITTFLRCSQSPLHSHHFFWLGFPQKLPATPPSSQSEHHLTIFSTDLNVVYFVNMVFKFSASLFEAIWVNNWDFETVFFLTCHFYCYIFNFSEIWFVNFQTRTADFFFGYSLLRLEIFYIIFTCRQTIKNYR